MKHDKDRFKPLVNLAGKVFAFAVIPYAKTASGAFKPAIAIEGQKGWITADSAGIGGPGWVLGHTAATAQETADDLNRRLSGVSPARAMGIINQAIYA